MVTTGRRFFHADVALVFRSCGEPWGKMSKAINVQTEVKLTNWHCRPSTILPAFTTIYPSMPMPSRGFIKPLRSSNCFARIDRLNNVMSKWPVNCASDALRRPKVSSAPSSDSFARHRTRMLKTSSDGMLFECVIFFSFLRLHGGSREVRRCLYESATR